MTKNSDARNGLEGRVSWLERRDVNLFESFDPLGCSNAMPVGGGPQYDDAEDADFYNQCERQGHCVFKSLNREDRRGGRIW
jgi:hypothetical protein